MCVALARNYHLGVRRCAAVFPCLRGSHFHHECAPLLHQIATLGAQQCAAALPCVRGAHFQLLWLLLAAPGCLWLLLAASGCSWVPLTVIDVNGRSKENNLFGVWRWNHTSILLVCPLFVCACIPPPRNPAQPPLCKLGRRNS
jgi:hypothetical protein